MDKGTFLVEIDNTINYIEIIIKNEHKEDLRTFIYDLERLKD